MQVLLGIGGSSALQSLRAYAAWLDSLRPAHIGFGTAGGSADRICGQPIDCQLRLKITPLTTRQMTFATAC
jgi:hypothetical protein